MKSFIRVIKALLSPDRTPRLRINQYTYISRGILLSDLASLVEEAGRASTRTILIAHFPETFDLVSKQLENIGVEKSGDLDAPRESSNVSLLLSRDLSEDSLTHLLAGQGGKTRVIIVDTAPTPERDWVVANSCNKALPGLLPLRLFSIDDPILPKSLSETVRSLFSSHAAPGVRNESPLIANQVHLSQTRIQSKVPHPQQADSAGEWFAKNLPDW